MVMAVRAELWGFILTALVASTVSAENVASFPEELVLEQSTTRIVSGWEAVEGQFPYQLSVRAVNILGVVIACGGAIIHAEWGLSAAHCTSLRHSFIIRAGAVNLTRPEILFEATEFYNHPLYDSFVPSLVQSHDIGLIKFGRALKLSDRVQPVRLQASRDMNRNYDGVRLVATGWGALWTREPPPENMHWVYLRGTTNDFCREQFSQSAIIVDSTICAMYYNVSSQSTCAGDHGGALTVEDKDGVISLVGIASFVSNVGCHVSHPAGFIRPGHYHTWYKEITGIDFDWELEPETSEPDTDEESSGFEDIENEKFLSVYWKT